MGASGRPILYKGVLLMKQVTMREKIAKYAIDYRNEVEGKETEESREIRVDEAFNNMHRNYTNVITRLNNAYSVISKEIKTKTNLSPESYVKEIIDLETSLGSISKAIQINKHNRLKLGADKNKMRGSIKELVFVLDIVKNVKNRDMSSIIEGISFDTKQDFIDMLVNEELLNVKTFNDEVYTLAEISARTVINELMKVEESFIDQYPSMEAEYVRVKNSKGFKDVKDAYNFIKIFENVKPTTTNEDEIEKFELVNKTLAGAINSIRGIMSMSATLETAIGTDQKVTDDLMKTIVETSKDKHISTLKAIYKIVDYIYGEETTNELLIGVTCVLYGVFGVELAPAKVSQLSKML